MSGRPGQRQCEKCWKWWPQEEFYYKGLSSKFCLGCQRPDSHITYFRKVMKVGQGSVPILLKKPPRSDVPEVPQ